MANRAYQTIPQPPRIPVVGHALTLDRQAPMQNLVRFAKEFGPIFQIDIMGAPMVFVSDVDMVAELCDETRFNKAVRGSLARVRKIAGNGLFTARSDDPAWGKAHNILLAPFGGRAMQSYHPAMVDIASQLCLKWERLNPDDEIDVVHDMTALTLDTIGLCGFDYRFNSFYRRDYHPFVEAMVRSLETSMMRRGLPFENLLMRDRIATLDEDVAFMNALVDDLVRERRETAVNNQKDLLNAMLNGVDKASGEPLDDVNIRYQIITFLIAGHETTSGLLSYSIAALLKHPEALAKAYEEVDRVLGRDLAVKPTYAQISKLTYISQILKESLRLWPPAPAFGLQCEKDETIGDGYVIPKNTLTLVLIPALHRDPAIWGPDPEAFNPDRFTRAAEAARPTHAWKPFGNGQRACIGRGFAMHEAALALAMALQRFKLIDCHNYQLRIKETLTTKPEGLKIKVVPRDPDRSYGPGLSGGGAALPAQPPAAEANASTLGSAPVSKNHDTPLLVLYGSNLGVAEELAHRLAEIGEINGFAAECAPLDSYVGALPRQGGLLIVSASYNGAPPDNAMNFVRWIKADHPADMLKGLQYAVFGCGDRDWAATYQAIPRLIDERLAALGAARIAPRGEGDARDDIESGYETWFTALRPSVVEAFGLDAPFERSAAASLYSVEPVAALASTPAADLVSARAAQILVNQELLRNKSDPYRSTRHIEVRLPDGMAYRAGDHLAVAPRNDRALVAAVALRFGFSPDDYVRLRAADGRRTLLPVGESLSIESLLGSYVELQNIATRKQIKILADHTRCPQSQSKLLAFCAETEDGNNAYRQDILSCRVSVFDLLMRYPACELPFADYLEMLPSLQPRYYSIASSALRDPAQCAITVAVVASPARSGRGVYKGACSNYLAGMAPGATIHASIRPAADAFHLPEDPQTPIMMIGPGTGVAPFRGFLWERAVLREKGEALGPAMMFFGCRRPDQDFLYQQELLDFSQAGLVDLHVAFSRPETGEKRYVQDVLREQSSAVWALLQAGGKIYVCGDGGRMEPDVRRALIEIFRAETGGDQAAGEQWLGDLIAQERYCLDVWAGS